MARNYSHLPPRARTRRARSSSTRTSGPPEGVSPAAARRSAPSAMRCGFAAGSEHWCAIRQPPGSHYHQESTTCIGEGHRAHARPWAMDDRSSLAATLFRFLSALGVMASYRAHTWTRPDGRRGSQRSKILYMHGKRHRAQRARPILQGRIRSPRRWTRTTSRGLRGEEDRQGFGPTCQWRSRRVRLPDLSHKTTQVQCGRDCMWGPRVIHGTWAWARGALVGCATEGYMGRQTRRTAQAMEKLFSFSFVHSYFFFFSTFNSKFKIWISNHIWVKIWSLAICTIKEILGMNTKCMYFYIFT
jgi:hypothetical protein